MKNGSFLSSITARNVGVGSLTYASYKSTAKTRGAVTMCAKKDDTLEVDKQDEVDQESMNAKDEKEDDIRSAKAKVSFTK